jgi:hypothetical protein
VVATLAVAMFVAGPASANTVHRHVVSGHVKYVDRRTCDFPITVRASGTYLVAKYYDNSGLRYKKVVSAHGQFTLAWTANGTTLTMPNQSFHLVITYDAAGKRQTTTYDGPVYVFTVPGGGVVLLDAGRLVFDRQGNILFEAGPHQSLHGDVGAFCAAFG